MRKIKKTIFFYKFFRLYGNNVIMSFVKSLRVVGGGKCMIRKTNSTGPCGYDGKNPVRSPW